MAKAFADSQNPVWLILLMIFPSWCTNFVRLARKKKVMFTVTGLLYKNFGKSRNFQSKFMRFMACWIFSKIFRVFVCLPFCTILNSQCCYKISTWSLHYIRLSWYKMTWQQAEIHILEHAHFYSNRFSVLIDWLIFAQYNSHIAVGMPPWNGSLQSYYLLIVYNLQPEGNK